MSESRNDAGYERSDAHLKPLIVFSIALAVLVAVALWVVAVMESRFDLAREGKDPLHPLSDLREPPAGPALQANPRIEMGEYLRWEEDLLTRYAWVDRENAIVRIPVERAMTLTVERGLPHRNAQEEGR